MMQAIDKTTQMVVDLRSFSEIKGAESVDLDAGQVSVREATYDGEVVVRTIHLPIGVKIVRRGR